MSARNYSEQINLNLVDGAAANTDMTLAGLEVGDMIKSVLNLTDMVQVSLAGLVVSAGKFKITAATTGKKLQVLWIDKSAG